MEKDWPREYINKHIMALSMNTKFEDDQLLDYLIQADIIKGTAKDFYTQFNTDYKRASKLYEMIPTRGINGYKKLIEALDVTNQTVAKDILLKGLPKHGEAGDQGFLQNLNPLSIPGSSRGIQPSEEVSLEILANDPDIKDLFSKEVFDYVFNGKPLDILFQDQDQIVHDAVTSKDANTLGNVRRGLACILNVVEFDPHPTKYLEKRDSSLYDVKNFKKFWEQLDYAVMPMYKSELEGKRKTEDDFTKYIEDFKEKCKIENPASIVVFIGSHGCYEKNKGSCFSTSDHELIYVKDVVEKFYRSNCPPELQGKPKIFFVQACQDIISVPDDVQLDENAEDYNILVFQATSPGRKAFRDHVGSWFVNCFISAFQTHGKSKSLQEIMKITSNMVEILATKKVVDRQKPSVSKNTMKPLYFKF